MPTDRYRREVRLLAVVASLALVVGCTSGESAPQTSTTAASPTAADDPPASPASPEVIGDPVNDPCSLLTDDELVALAGTSVGPPNTGLSSGSPNCQWRTADGRTLQVIAASSSDWAQSLPEALRALTAAGLVSDATGNDNLKKAAALVEGGGTLDPTAACGLFSELLELRGEPAGTPFTVNIVPSRDDPQMVNGQICSGGRFTSVAVMDAAGLSAPLPVEQVIVATQTGHRRALS